jgi:repressor LexA
MIGANDLCIAARARSLGLGLVPNNIAEFNRVKGLRLENWTTRPVRRARRTADTSPPRIRAMPPKPSLPRADGEVTPSASFDDARPFTAKQGQYLAFIYYYTKIHRTPPAEADFCRFFQKTPPVVHQMIKTLHAHRLIERESGKARSIRLRLTRAQLPDLE